MNNSEDETKQILEDVLLMLQHCHPGNQMPVHIGDYFCRECNHEWTAPWPVPGKKCPKCHGEKIILKDNPLR